MATICCKKNRRLWLYILTAICLLTAPSAYSQEQLRIPLTKFNTPGTVQLTDSEDEYSLKIAMPKRWQLGEATLELGYVNSTALLASRSRLVILFNNYPLAQITLEPQAPEGRVTVTIPPRLFKVGYNDLKFQVAQAFTDEGCIPENPPEVWTTLEFLDSTLEFSYTMKEVPLSLSSIADFLFDPKISGENRVHIVTETTSDQDVTLAILAAAAVANRFEYRPVQFTTGRTLQPETDNIVIGSHSFFQRVSGESTLDYDMAIFPLPEPSNSLDRLHALIYLGGTAGTEIRRSVEAFSVLSLPLPDVQSCTIEGVQLPPISAYSGKNRLAPEKRYTFQELGVSTTTFRGQGNNAQSLQFTLPASFLLEGNRDILLRLDFSYGAAMRNDSVLSLTVNGKFVSSIALNSPTGGQYKGYTIRLPLSYFQPGQNVLQLTPLMMPLHTRDCEAIQTEHLALTLFESSTVEVPELSQWVKLPQLKYLFNDGFPLTAVPDFSQTSIVLEERNDTLLAAALNLIAGISQKTGVLPYGLTVIDTPAASEENMLVIASRGAVPKDILLASPLAKDIAMPIYGRLPGTLHIETWKEKFWRLLLEEYTDVNPVAVDIASLQTDLVFKEQQAILCEFESPFSPMKTVVLLTAETADDVLHASLLLQDNEVTQQCRDGLVVIDFEGRKPVVQQASLTPSYSMGKITLYNHLSYLVDKYRWHFGATLAGLLICLSLGLTILLKRRRRKRLHAMSQEEE